MRNVFFAFLALATAFIAIGISGISGQGALIYVGVAFLLIAFLWLTQHKRS